MILNVACADLGCVLTWVWCKIIGSQANHWPLHGGSCCGRFFLMTLAAWQFSKKLVFHLFHATALINSIYAVNKVWDWGSATVLPPPPETWSADSSLNTCPIFPLPLHNNLSRAGLRTCRARHWEEAMQDYIKSSVLRRQYHNWMGSKPLLHRLWNIVTTSPPS